MVIDVVEGIDNTRWKLLKSINTIPSNVPIISN
jgi:hypothetical protein